MNEHRRAQPGELVTVGDLPQTFRVIDFDGATFVLESEHGARCRAGVLVVRLVEKKAKKVVTIGAMEAWRFTATRGAA